MEIAECQKQFVTSKQDVCGHVAFSMFFESRIDLSSNSENDINLEISAADVAAWRKSIENDALDKYRRKFLESELPEILEEYRDRRLEALSEANVSAINKNTERLLDQLKFWKAVAASIVAWFIGVFISLCTILYFNFEQIASLLNKL